AKGGELGWFATQQLPPAFAEAAAGWDHPGEIKGPITTQYGIHILRLLDHQAEKSFTIDEDFDRIKELARQDKTGKMIDDWIEKLKEKTYIKTSLNP
ncbi:MAG: peptidylprolyl isomerase, partial [candidate division Zixibacteria bacterium]|nr:peptidylprolyl isomerase [candidate division Zixibacteria bacterium]